jgi:hypothetical protein
VNDDPVEAVVDKRQQVTKQPGEEFHGQPHDMHDGAQTG